MTKRKRKSKKKSQKINFFSDLDPNIKKTIYGVVLLTVALLLAFSLFDSAGVWGEKFNEILAKGIGIGRYFIPPALLSLSLMYFRRLENIVYLTLWFGILLIFLSFLGMVHILNDPKELLQVAQKGEAGGYLGYYISNTFLEVIGRYASIVIFLASLVIGVLISFNSYLARIINDYDKKKKQWSKAENIDEKKQEEKDRESAEEKVKISRQKQGWLTTVKNLFKNFLDRFDKQDLESSPNSPTPQDKKQEDSSKDNDGQKVKVSSNQEVSLGVDSNKISQNKPVEAGVAKIGLSEQKTRWVLPPTSLLQSESGKPEAGNIEENSQIIEKSLQNFGITAKVVDVNIGPTVTQYEVKPAQGVRLSKIVALQSDLSMSLAAHPLRIEAPIPGKSLVGIEIPNQRFALVRIRNVIESPAFKEKQGLVFTLGQDSAGNYICADVTEMPHLLIAGATGAGKSIGIANIIVSFLYKFSPDDLKLILIDPKRVELSVYNGIPHLLTPVIVDVDKVVNSLKWAVNEMERRYKILQEFGTRDLESYNAALRKKEEKTKPKEEYVVTKSVDGLSRSGNSINYKTRTAKKDAETEHEKLPYIVIILDELADIMVTHGKEVEVLIVRIAQKARAVGIHLILSTQRPSVQVITGLIKANIPARIAYQVASQIDSRTILDMAGAEKLLGKGDMLFMARDTGRPKRVQGSFIDEKEIKKVVKFLKKQSPVEYNEEVVESQTVTGLESVSGSSPDSSQESEYEDDLFEEAKETVIENKKASATFLQRKLRIGYARAARIMEMLEEAGVIGPQNGSKPREILISKDSNNIDQQQKDPNS
ncbi:MAG: hypothetical protein GF335_02135 [Candidatus Moranbacteria bacterium]|nr:hypothetical protein [Candidatus Moranbacteria bacterium]